MVQLRVPARAVTASRAIRAIAARGEAIAPHASDFSSRLRSPAVAARIGVWLGTCFLVAFVTGLYSHVSQVAVPWVPLPTRPVWIYRVTQGLHVISGTAAVPLLLVKLWTVYPRLFLRLDLRDKRELLLQTLERGSIAVLVVAAIFQLATGLANSAQWYPWAFAFPATHFAVAWIVMAALATHIAVKLPIIRSAFAHDVDSDAVADPDLGASSPARSSPLSRRGLLRVTWLATGVAVIATAGATVPALRKISVFGDRSGGGPQNLPVNKSAVAAGVVDLASSNAYRLTISAHGRTRRLSRSDLLALPQTTATLPISCVEGWSAAGTWTGVRVRDVLALVGADRGHHIMVTSLQPGGAYRQTILQANFVADPDTLLALSLNGAPLDIDHGYPCRVIAPGRPGVLQTKWVSELAVQA